MNEIRIEAVSETLFLPLYALALESVGKNPIIVDEGAVKLTKRLNEAFRDSHKPIFKRLVRGKLPRALVTTLALRIRHYDRCVRDFLKREPDGVVVNLGCGLDDRRRRVDNGKMRWYDLDLPEVIELRRSFLDETERCRFIGSSVLDFDWLDRLPKEPGDKFLFVAEGLFMYLPAEGVRSLVLTLLERYPGSELLAETAHSKIVRMMKTYLGRTKFRRQFGLSEDVVYRFGLDDSRDMEAWNPRLKLLDDWTYFGEPEPKLGLMRLFGRWSFFRQIQWTVRYKLGE